MAQIQPRVSVLLPVRDAGPTLPACLESLAAQSLADYEIVAVDDASRDDSWRQLDAAAASDPRIVPLRAGGRGLVAALNTAAAAARAPLLARMDADDVSHPERLGRQAHWLDAHPDVAILGCAVRVLGGAPGNAGMRSYVSWSNALLDHAAIVRDLWVESPLVHPSVMLRADALRALGGYRAFDGPEDYDLWLRAHARGLHFAKLPEILLDWRDAPGRLTRSDPRYAAERFRLLKIEAIEAGPLRRPRAVVVWGAGPIGKGWARELRRRGHAVAAFVEVDPRKIGQHIHGAAVVDLSAAGGFPGALHLAAVGHAEARERIRAAAGRLGIVEDLVAVA